ncbi:MAG: adenylate/guanylate cyclase domain-containing protein [Alphaproteobacteria bacterium]|nr:adenylate/guanylate cyclase domain-containing protein [Alphaproteobacteria bacterium]
MTSETGRRFCRACGRPADPGDRFCGQCGTALAEAKAPTEATPSPSADSGERRQVAILFADLSGFTELSSARDPEEVHGLLERFFEVVDQTVVRFGGTIDKHIGDGAMALFGAPIAHGNDAERAVRAALAIHTGIEKLSRDLDTKLRCHIGIASGEVVASDVGSAKKRDYTVLGQSVNLAARLMGAAAPEQTIVSEPVHRAVAELVEAEALAPIALKGIVEPVAAFRIRGIAPAGKRLSRRAMVGRRTERRLFEALLTNTQNSRRGAILLVRGEAGIGKTRLTAYFRHRARKKGFATHIGHVLDFGSAGGEALGAIVRSLLRVATNTDEAMRRQAADDALARRDLDADQLLFLYDLLDVPLTAAMRATLDSMSSATRSEGRSACLVRIARRRARKKPRLIIVEDVHWADPSTLETLAHLARGARHSPYLMVMTTRPERDPIDTAWRAAAGGTAFATLDLAPLLKVDAERLAARFLAPDNRDAKRCIGRAAGNPLFLEQLLLSARAGELDRLPGSVQSVVLARIDRLEPPDRRTIQAASVLGQRFTADAVAHLLDVPLTSCDALVHHNLVRPVGADFLFAHALIREGVYGALLKRRRVELHRRAASWFATRDPALRAEHLERAEDAGAPNAYLAAARQQTEQYRHVAALGLARRGLALAVTEAQRYALCLLEAEILRELGQHQGAVKSAKQAFKFSSDEPEQARALISVAEGLRVLDKLDDAMVRLRKAERLLAKGDHPLERARIHFLRGNLYFPMGRVAECLAEHEQALIQAKFAASIEGEVRALGGIADALYVQGRYRSAYENFERCVAQADAHGLGRIVIANRPMLCASASLYGWLDKNRQHGEQAIADAVRAGNKRAELVARTAFAIGELDAHAHVSLRAQIDACYKVLKTIDAPRFFYQVQGTEALHLLQAEGRSPRALLLIREALNGAREIGLMSYLGGLMLAVLGYATDDDAERSAALAEAEALIATGVPFHNVVLFFSLAIELFIERGEWDQVELYANTLEASLGPEPSLRSVHEIALARCLIALHRDGKKPGLKSALTKLKAEQEDMGKVYCRAAIEAALKRFKAR